MAVLRGVIFFPILFWLREALCVLQQQDVVVDVAIYVDQQQDRSLAPLCRTGNWLEIG
jgi:hypothetical protein